MNSPNFVAQRISMFTCGLLALAEVVLEVYFQIVIQQYSDYLSRKASRKLSLEYFNAVTPEHMVLLSVDKNLDSVYHDNF